MNSAIRTREGLLPERPWLSVWQPNLPGTAEKTGAIQSISARGDPCHNTWTESFIGPPENEMPEGGWFTNSDDARTELLVWIEAYHNTCRGTPRSIIRFQGLLQLP